MYAQQGQWETGLTHFKPQTYEEALAHLSFTFCEPCRIDCMSKMWTTTARNMKLGWLLKVFHHNPCQIVWSILILSMLCYLETILLNGKHLRRSGGAFRIRVSLIAKRYRSVDLRMVARQAMSQTTAPSFSASPTSPVWNMQGRSWVVNICWAWVSQATIDAPSLEICAF